MKEQIEIAECSVCGDDFERSVEPERRYVSCPKHSFGEILVQPTAQNDYGYEVAPDSDGNTYTTLIWDNPVEGKAGELKAIIESSVELPAMTWEQFKALTECPLEEIKRLTIAAQARAYRQKAEELEKSLGEYPF